MDGFIKMPSGAVVDPVNQIGEFLLEDIVRGISGINRYGGCARPFYSVAEHCLIVADQVEKATNSHEAVLFALFHDAAEAYMGDIPGPIKKNLWGFASAIDGLQAKLEKDFNVDQFRKKWKAIVHHFDKAVVPDEMDYCVGGSPDFIPDPIGVRFFGLSADEAEKMWMERWESSWEKVNGSI